MIAALINPSTQKEHNVVNVTTSSNPALQNSNSIASNAGNVTSHPSSIVSNAVYKEMSEDEDDHIILIGSAEINKNKLKSLLGKASSLFKRKGNKHDDDDKTISIANFELKK